MARAKSLVRLAGVVSLGSLVTTAAADPIIRTQPHACRDSAYALATTEVDARSVASAEIAATRDDFDTAKRLNALAERSLDARVYAEAEPLLRRALSIADHALEPADPQILPIVRNLAGLYFVENEFCGAERLYRRALTILERRFGTASLGVSGALNDLAAVYVETRRFDLAEPLYRRALEIFEEAFGTDNLHVTIGLNNLADLYVAAGRYAQAEPLYRRSLVILERTYGPTDRRVATLCEKHARVLVKLGQEAEAGIEQARANAIRESGENPVPSSSLMPGARQL